MNAFSEPDPVQRMSQISNDACAPPPSVRREQNGVEFVSQERMSILGLEGPGLPLALPPGPGRFRQALNALLRHRIVIIQPLLAFVVGLRVPLQRVQSVLLQGWVATVLCIRQAQHVLLQRWMAADFRTRQLPIFAIAAAIWASTVWMAWRAEDSSTPLLRSRLAAVTYQRVHPAELAGRPASRAIAGPADPQDAVRPGSVTQQTSPGLSLDRIVEFLISGPTPRQERLANPRLQVWADTHTGLYYCPGDGGYRCRSRGHFMSQQEAQDDYFQPASGAACP